MKNFFGDKSVRPAPLAPGIASCVERELQMKLRTAVFSFLALAGSSPLFAAPVVDQFQLSTGGTAGVHGGFERAQTFTAGRSGLLSRLDFKIDEVASAGDMVISLYGATAGTPLEAAIRSITVDRSLLPVGWVEVDLSGLGFFVSAGTQYAFGLEGTEANGFWRFDLDVDTTDPYVGGGMFVRTGSNPFVTWTPNPVGPDDFKWDMTFQTWVDPAVTPTGVPEPASLALAVAALAALGATRRRPA